MIACNITVIDVINVISCKKKKKIVTILFTTFMDVQNQPIYLSKILMRIKNNNLWQNFRMYKIQTLLRSSNGGHGLLPLSLWLHHCPKDSDGSSLPFHKTLCKTQTIHALKPKGATLSPMLSHWSPIFTWTKFAILKMYINSILT